MTFGQQHISTAMSARSVLRRVLGVVLALSCSFSLASCDKVKWPRGKKTDFTFDGVEFKTKVEKVDKDERSHFRVEVLKATQTINGAKEAGRYAATRYCIEEYGSSKVAWIKGPDAENDTLSIVEGSLFLEGICKL